MTITVRPLIWSEPAKPNDTCRYDHVIAQTPIGTYSIEWKSWKEFDDRTLFLDGEFLDNGPDIYQSKAKAEAHYRAKVFACLETEYSEVTEP